MSNAMRKGSLLIILAAICAATLVGAPTHTYAAASGGASSYTDDSPGGGTASSGDPDNPDPEKLGVVSARPVLYMTPRTSLSTGESYVVSSVSLRGWLQPLYWVIRTQLGW